MSRTQKWQDVTLMNSKCSQMANDDSHSIYRAVIKNLKGDQCYQHKQKYNYYYGGKLLCAQCFSTEVLSNNRSIDDETKKKYEFIYSLQTILNHPLLLVIHEKDILSYPIEIIQLMVHSYKQLYQKKSDFKLKKVLVQSFIKRIKSRIDRLCQDILDNFNEMEENIDKQSELKQQLNGLAMMYQQQLLEMFAEKFVSTKKQDLQQLLQEYSSSNENPFPKISKNMFEMMNCLAQTPSLDLSVLQKIYTSVTDQLLWNPKKIVVPQKDYFQNKFQTANIIINNEQIILQSQYTLKIQQYQISLFMENINIGKLDIAIDSLYMFPNYKLIGVNYSKIVILNYFDQLTLQTEYQITGCTDILPFSQLILAISNEKLIKIYLTTREIQTIGYNYTDLRYCKNKPSYFACQNQHKITTYFNIWSNTPLTNQLRLQ